MNARSIALPTVWFAIACCCAPSLPAQAPPGPLPGSPPQDSAPDARPSPARPAVKPRDTILGAWIFNADESEDARERIRQLRASEASAGRPNRGIDERGGLGQPGSLQDRQRMQELLHPADSLAISMTGAEIDVIDDQNHKLAFITDGRQLRKSRDASYREIAAKWEGKSLVSDEKDSFGQKASRRFELSDDGRQLFETVQITLDRSKSLVIRYVYDQPAGSPSGRRQ